ncbi:MAG TPA: carboxypeptidase-like regulatory domain-containing protein, partial [Polyangia bacterium]|nr:carboxypeptidase-like regulatory domain-containing protein [Polyangia bacterium]
MNIERSKQWRVADVGLLALALALGAGCAADDGRDGADDGADDDSDTEYDGPAGSLGGTVLAPSGDFPISGALIYLSKGDAPEIPDSIYCYECEDMTGKWWTLSNPDGTWFLDNVPSGDWNLVVRKGFFQRQRAVTVAADEHLDVPISLTT